MGVKQLNRIMELFYFYTLKALWDVQGKIKMYYGMLRVKMQLLGKSIQLSWWNHGSGMHSGSSKPYGFDKMYMDNDLIEDKFHHLKHRFSERKITSVKFYSILLNKIHPFDDGNGRRCKILFANDDKIIKLIAREKKWKN